MRLNLARFFRVTDLPPQARPSMPPEMFGFGSTPPRVDLSMPLPIDRGLPIDGKRTLECEMDYLPFADMKIGDSFFVPVHEASIDLAEIGLHSAIDDYLIKHRGRARWWEFTARRVPGGLRCWRLI